MSNQLDKTDISAIAQIVNTEQNLATAVIFAENAHKRMLFVKNEMYDAPEFKDFFLYEEGVKDGKEAWLVEKSLEVGVIESVNDSLVTMKLNDLFKKKFPDFRMQLHAQQVWADGVEPKENDLVVYRTGCIGFMDDEDPVLYSYRACFSERDGYMRIRDRQDLKKYLEKNK